MLEPSYQSVHQVAFSEMWKVLDGKPTSALRARLFSRNTSIVGKSWSYLSSNSQIDDPVGFAQELRNRRSCGGTLGWYLGTQLMGPPP